MGPAGHDLGSAERASNQSWSPDGSQIVYMQTATNPDIFVSRADGSARTQLTTAAGGDCCPVWSFDGGRIAFESLRHGRFDIYVMASDGSGQTNLTPNAVYDGTPSWSPDGRIVYRSLRDNRNDLYAIREDGTASPGSRRPRRSTGSRRGPRTAAASRSRATGTATMNLRHECRRHGPDPADVRRGERREPVLVTRRLPYRVPLEPGGNYEVYVMDADGTDVTKDHGQRGEDILASWYPVMCTHAGTAGNDVIVGTEGDDVLCGFGGADVLNGMGGNDLLIGGDGDDTEDGGDGDDVFDQGGTRTAPTVRGESASTRSATCTGRRRHRHARRDERRRGVGEGDDVASTSKTPPAGRGRLHDRERGREPLIGGWGNDVLVGGAVHDVLIGVDGTDSVDVRDGIGGNDRADGGAQPDTCTIDTGDITVGCP